MIPLTIDWGMAASVAGKSFATVFLVLVVLAVVTWLIGFVLQKAKKRGAEAKPGDVKQEETKPKG